MTELPFAHGGPPLKGLLRDTPDDFVVIEDLGFAPNGEGEHVFVRLRKRGINTDWLAGRLAEFAGVPRSAVSYAGMKDRHAVTTQTFSVQIPGAEGPDWTQFPEDCVEVLDTTRNLRKLRRGALAGNAFVITLREVQGNAEAAEACLQSIAQQGVPNYFGEQRFGREGNNTQRALAFFAGKRTPRKQQGLLISAARSQIFNRVLAQRVENRSWQQIVPGEACCLAGSRSWFVAEDDLAALQTRADNWDIHPSGPLWGNDALPTQGQAAALEQAAAAAEAALKEGLEKQRLDHDRRPLRLRPTGLEWEWLDTQSLRLSFSLPAGSYATAVLRELVDWQEPQRETPSRTD